MRLRRARIIGFRNLRDVEVTFPDGGMLYQPLSLSFFVGANGSGKSNALEGIGLVFAHIAADTPPPLGFDIEYDLGGSTVRLTNRADIYPDMRVSQIDSCVLVRSAAETEWTRAHAREQWASSGSGILPRRIVGHSAGPATGLGAALRQSMYAITRAESSNEPGPPSEAGPSPSREIEPSPATYTDNAETVFVDARQAMLAAAALLVFAADATGPWATTTERIASRLSLTEDPLVSFSIHVPDEWDRRLTPQDRARFLQLLDIATSRTRFSSAGRIAGGTFPEGGRVTFDMDRSMAARLRSIADGPRELFELLLRWNRASAIGEGGVTLVLQKDCLLGPIVDRYLSDGEYLYLGRFALLAMFRDVPDVLVLLDEPDTHFNDAWKAELVQDLVDVLGSGVDRAGGAEVIVATQSDLTLSDADPDRAFLFRSVMGFAADETSVVPVPEPTFGSSLGEISRGIFGTPASVGSFAHQTLDRALKEGSETEIRSLAERVGPGLERFRIEEWLFRHTHDEGGPE